jgi:type II secretory pathway pseudopilin PulG
MVVVMLIGILAVIAIPSMTSAQLDRRAYKDAISIAELFREARTRAMGRGAAEMITMTQNGGTTGPNRGTFLLYEGQVIAAPPLGILPIGSPMSTCGAPTNWVNPGSTSVLVDGVNLNGSLDVQDGIWTTITGPNGAGGIGTLNSAFMCFTPLGRAYYSAGGAAPNFIPGSPMLGEVQIALQHNYGGGVGVLQTGITRTVIIPNSGATRIISK